jgi:hypothetical protein
MEFIMAEIKNGILGKISGTVGSVTGRIRKGKNILASKPSSYTPPMDNASINRRGKFKCDVLFSKAVVRLPDLKYTWDQQITGDMSAFNLVTQTNYKLLKNGLPSILNIVVPQLGFPVVAQTFELVDGSLNFTLAPVGNQDLFDPEIDKSIKLYAVIYLSSPIDAESEPYYFISCESVKKTFQTTEQIVFTIPLDTTLVPLLGMYSTKHIYAAFLTLDESEVPQQYSITLYK